MMMGIAKIAKISENRVFLMLRCEWGMVPSAEIYFFFGAPNSVKPIFSQRKTIHNVYMHLQHFPRIPLDHTYHFQCFFREKCAKNAIFMIFNRVLEGRARRRNF